ncbi:SCO6880 family protein [Promicromonospora sp. NPDC057488]|uniref:SCO6880 family protein n=1 Tax=Promicromonospora sp. NPDC057488 TaxID=3346147 RepID=UPI003672715B
MSDQAQTGGPLRAVKFSRLSKRALLLGLTATQLATIGIGGLPLVIALYTGTGAHYAIVLLAGAAAAALVPVGGRQAITWVPIAGSWAWRTVTGQRDFRARTTGRVARPRPAGTLALPGDAAALRQYTDPITGAVLVHDPHAATLTALLPVTHPAFMLLDPGEQQRRVTAWGRVLATVSRSGHIAALQVTERTLPGSGASLADWWQAHGTHDESFASRTYADLIGRAGPAGEQHATTIALSLDLNAAARTIRAAGGGLRGGATVLRQEVETLTIALRAADLTPGEPYDAGRLAVHLRTSYDPAIGPALERHPTLGRELAAAGPIAVTETWGQLRADGARHCVLWIAQWPQSPTYPGFLAPLLLSSGVERTISLTYRPVRTDAAMRELRRRRTGHLSDATQRARMGQTSDATDQAELADVLQQEADLAAGHSLLTTTGLITISAQDAERLEHDVAAVEQAAIQAGVETRRLWGQQAQAFARTVLPS